MDADEGRQSLLSTASKNSESLISCVLNEKNISEFLHRDKHILIRPTNIIKSEQEVLLNIDYDIDGIVLELKVLTAIKFQIRYINLCPYSSGRLSSVFNILKKHLNLNKFKQNLHVLRHAKGYQVFYEHGWECYLSLIPSAHLRGVTTETQVQNISVDYFQKLVFQWRLALYKLLENGKCRETLQKNKVSTTTKLHVLPDDQSDILQALSACIDSCPHPQGYVPYLFVFRFGERRRTNFDINDFDKDNVTDESLHIAVTLSGTYDIGYLWSRQGLQRIVGERGCISSCLSFSEAANFQSNLDGRLLDISRHLRDVIRLPCSIRFVQFYGDTPHINPSTRSHPVSGSIVNCGLLNKQCLERFEREALNYICTCRDNFSSLRTLTCRLEFVLVPTQVTSNIDPCSYIDGDHLSRLLEKEALLVPFDLTDDTLCLALRGIGEHLVKTLSMCFTNGKRLGGYENTWKAYQAELAIEKFLWGRPLFYSDRQNSINLGPGIQAPTRSTTDYLGFLALEDPSSVSLGDTPPVLSTWFKSGNIKQEIENIFGFSDYITSNNLVLGRRVLEIILTDLYLGSNRLPDRIRFNGLLCDLKSDRIPQWALCSGSISSSQISDMICYAKSVKTRLAMKRMFEILNLSGKCIKSIVKEAIIESGLRFFPAVRTYDSSRNRTLVWNGLHLWTITISSSSTQIDESLCHSFTKLLINQLVGDGYLHESKISPLRKINNFSFPWIRIILLKLKGSNLNETDKTTLLLFCSCVGLLQQGWYVSYEKLDRLVQSLPVQQIVLRRMEILSTKLLGCMSRPKIYRLHDTISFKLSISEPRQENLTGNIKDQKGIDVDVPLCYGDDDLRSDLPVSDDIEENVILQPNRHHSANMNTKWSAEELEHLYEVAARHKNLNAREKYAKYVDICLKSGVPDRTFKAFERKLSRLQI